MLTLAALLAGVHLFITPQLHHAPAPHFPYVAPVTNAADYDLN